MISGSYNFLWVPASTAAVNPNYIKILLANGWSTFFINGKPTFTNGPRRPPRNPPDSIVFDIWIFDSFILINYLQKFDRDLQLG